MILVQPTEDQVDTAVVTAVTSMLPAGTPVVRGQANRVPEVSAPNFVIFQPVRRPRLSTNVDTFADCRMIGALAAQQLTVSVVDFGSISIGAKLFGVDVAANQEITAQDSGTPGGIGVYSVSIAQTLVAQVMACGTKPAQQQTDVTYQIDCHGPFGGDFAQRIATLFRDDFGVDAFAAALPEASPLYAEDPRQIPFINAESQYEDRWIVEVHLQVSETIINIPQQFADSAIIGLIDVDAMYPP